LVFPSCLGEARKTNMKTKEPEYHMIQFNGKTYVLVEDIEKMLERLKTPPAPRKETHDDTKR